MKCPECNGSITSMVGQCPLCGTNLVEAFEDDED